MVESKITAKGQTTLPKAVREALSVSPGDRVLYIIQEGEVRMTKARPIKRLFGTLKYNGPPMSLKEMDLAIAEGAAESCLP